MGPLAAMSSSYGSNSNSFRRSIILALCSVTCLLSYATAYEMTARNDKHIQSFLDSLAEDGVVYVDHRPSPILPDLLVKRTVNATSSTAAPSGTLSSSVISLATTRSANSSSTSSQSKTSSSSSSTPTYTATGLPQPFDTSLGNNFTATSCPTFFNAFLNNATFKSCLPVSLLLQNSLTFFQAVRSPSVLVQTLDTSCAASLAICSPLMTSIATNLIDPSNCGQDYTRQNPIVAQAYAGLLAYEATYKAACLEDPTNSTQYCLAEALTSSTNPSDAYPYYTAIGIALPTSATPTCSQCLSQTMAIFAGYARMKGQPLTGTYLNAAKQIDIACGANFANTSVSVASTGKTSGTGSHVHSAHSMRVSTTTVLGLVVSLFTALVL